MRPRGGIHVGISGWRYAPWRGNFYPKKLPQRQELAFASRVLGSIEINGSHYSLQRPSSYERWYRDTPQDFVFAVKGSRFITHMKRLTDIDQGLANFFASGLLRLRGKLGPILWQFPASFAFEPLRMREFLERLPRDTAQCAALARKRQAFMKGRTALAVDAVRPLRHAVEIRHESFAVPEFIELLRATNTALVIAETARRYPLLEDITADFVYLRLHGDKKLYASGYSDRALERWAGRIRAWHAGAEPADARKAAPLLRPRRRVREVFCYFDNTDVKLRAPFDAQSLARKLEIARQAAAEPGLPRFIQ